MKFSFCTLLAMFLVFSGMASPAASLDKLTEVNRYWQLQPAAALASVPEYRPMSETQWIQLHLSLVEQSLRATNTLHLTASQKKNRSQALDDLHAYWSAGQFPRNEDYSFRTPIFIDRHDNFCAVGYLVKASGHEAVSRKIAAQTNLAYVMDMNYRELDQWAYSYGFSKEELAWIQPGYPPKQGTQAVGAGVNGQVNALLTWSDGQKMFVAGSFDTVDGNIAANNIAYVTENNGTYTWHPLGEGTDGPVHTMLEVDGNLIVAGHFNSPGSNVAVWDGNNWQALGCTYGSISQLIMYKNELYAVGEFDVCAALSDVNVARWNDTYWQHVFGLQGRVNAVEVVNDDLVLGGRFYYVDDTLNIAKWNIDDPYQYHPFANTIKNEVMDLHWFNDTLYAACRQQNPNDTSLLLMLNDDTWENAMPAPGAFSTLQPPMSFNRLHTDGDRLMTGGNFNYSPIVGVWGHNCIAINEVISNSGEWFDVDSAINAFATFKGALYAGGKFKKGSSNSTVLNGIARRINEGEVSIKPVTAELTFNIYPNPVPAQKIIIEQSFDANLATITDVAGRHIASIALQGNKQQQEVELPRLASGLYMIGLSNDKGNKAIKKIIID